MSLSREYNECFGCMGQAQEQGDVAIHVWRLFDRPSNVVDRRASARDDRLNLTEVPFVPEHLSWVLVTELALYLSLLV